MPPKLQCARWAGLCSRVQNGYMWIYSSWRPVCRLNCFMLWEPSPSTWSPERHKAITFHRYRETLKHEDEEAEKQTAKRESGTKDKHRPSTFWSCASWMFVSPFPDLMYLYHNVPHPPPSLPLAACCEVISALKGYVQSLTRLFSFYLLFFVLVHSVCCSGQYSTHVFVQSLCINFSYPKNLQVTDLLDGR